MVENLFSLVLQTLTFCSVTYLIYFCIKIKRALNILLRKLTAMDCDEILAALQADAAELARGASVASVSCAATTPEPACAVSATSEKLQRMRARLAALACGGQACVALGVSFKGRPLTSERVDVMEDTESEELHARYEARLGAAMSKSIGSSLLLLYASRQPDLVADLEQDPFVSSALQSACRELYYRYGMYLAPLTAALTTAKHCAFEPPIEETSAEGDTINYSTDDGCRTGTEGACSSACGATCSAIGERP